jgi:hypothetical protein
MKNVYRLLACTIPEEFCEYTMSEDLSRVHFLPLPVLASIMNPGGRFLETPA